MRLMIGKMGQWRIPVMRPSGHGADMFWDHADTDTYLRWLTAAQLRPIWARYVPEGDSGHSLVLAQASQKRVRSS
jgi:hypothetical protein